MNVAETASLEPGDWLVSNGDPGPDYRGEFVRTRADGMLVDIRDHVTGQVWTCPVNAVQREGA